MPSARCPICERRRTPGGVFGCRDHGCGTWGRVRFAAAPTSTLRWRATGAGWRTRWTDEVSAQRIARMSGGAVERAPARMLPRKTPAPSLPLGRLVVALPALRRVA